MKTKLIHWTPRVICILAILFVSMFALDSFSPELSIWQQIGGFLMHLIPSYILLVFLLIAWKWELVGGVLLLLISLGFSPFIYQHNFNMNHSVLMSLQIIFMINFPFMLSGSLFIWEHFIKNKKRLNNISILLLVSSTLFINGCNGSFKERQYENEVGRNLGFEVVKNGLPINWFFYTNKTIKKLDATADFDIISDQSDVKEGKQSLKFVIRKCNTIGRFYPGFFKEFEETSGKIYNVSFWVKNYGCEFKVILSAVRAKGGVPCEARTISSDENIKEWKQYVVERKMCEGMDRLRFEVVLQGSGTFQIDGIKIDKQ